MRPNWRVSSSSVNAIPTLTVFTISAGSRPTAAQCSSSTPALRAHSSGGMNGTFHPSACCATSFSVTFSPPPPIQIGSRSCTGFGSHCASVSVKNSPLNDVCCCVSNPRTHCVLAEHAQALSGGAVVHAVHLVLLLEPAAAEPEDDAAVGDLVERRHRVGEHR